MVSKPRGREQLVGTGTYLISISLSVCASRTIRRMHGGGVMGLRSWSCVKTRWQNNYQRKNHPPYHQIHTYEPGWAVAPLVMTRSDHLGSLSRVPDGRIAVASWAQTGIGRTEQRCDPLRAEVGRDDVYPRRRTWYRIGRNRGWTRDR